MFAGLDADSILRQRDDAFDQAWIRAAEPIQIAWEKSARSRSTQSEIDAVRQAAFEKVLQLSEGDEDLAGTVGDDFEIICKQAITGSPSPFIDSLRESYESNRIPH